MRTLPEVAQRLRMPYRAAYDLVLTGKLPAERIGRSFLVREEELESYLRARATASDFQAQGQHER